jgi:hypothetical protein
MTINHNFLGSQIKNPFFNKLYGNKIAHQNCSYVIGGRLALVRYFLKADFSFWFSILFKKLLYGFKHNVELFVVFCQLIFNYF